MATEETPQAAPPQEPQYEAVEIELADGKVTLMPTSEQEATTLAELKKGYLRQDDYTKKRQADVQRMSELEREREQYLAAGGRPRAGLDAGGYGGPGQFTVPGAVGGQHRAGTYPQDEHPATGTPTVRGPDYIPAPEPVEEGDLITLTQARRLFEREAAARQVDVDQRLTYLQQTIDYQNAERQVDQMEADIPGFSRAAVEQAWRGMSMAERSQYAGLPRASAYKLVYYDHIRETPPVSAETPPAEGVAPKPPEEQAPPAPPHAETVRPPSESMAPSPRVADDYSRAGAMAAGKQLREQAITKNP